MNSHFVPYLAMGGEKGTAELAKRFDLKISLGLLLVKSDGTLLDTYSSNFGIRSKLATPEQIIAALDKSLKGVDTLSVLSARFTRNPRDVEAAFKLAGKYDEIGERAKVADFYKKVVALDPKTGTMDLPEGKVPYKEYAEFKLAEASFYPAAVEGQFRLDPTQYKAFISKYPQSVLVKQAHRSMVNYYISSASKTEAADFFSELLSKYPNEVWALRMNLYRIGRDKDPAEADKGIALLDKIEEIKGAMDFYDRQQLANLYQTKGDQEKADEAVGKEWFDSTRNQWAYYDFGYARYWIQRKKNLDDAEAAIEQAISISSGSWSLRNQAAGLYLQLNKPEKALKVYGPELTRTKSGTVDELFSYMNFWAPRKENLDNVLEVAKQVETVTLSGSQWHSLAQTYFNLKRHDDARRAILKAIDKESNEQMKARYATLQKQIADAMNQGAAGK